MYKKIVVVGVLFCFFYGSFIGARETLSALRANFVEVLRTADQQREYLLAIVAGKDGEFKEPLLSEVAETVKKLETYRELLMAQKLSAGLLANSEAQCLTLAQELIRQLTNARLGYQQKMQKTIVVKKIAISAGAGATVVGGLLVLRMLTPLDVSMSAILACGVAAGCLVGAVTYYHDCVQPQTL